MKNKKDVVKVEEEWQGDRNKEDKRWGGVISAVGELVLFF